MKRKEKNQSKKNIFIEWISRFESKTNKKVVPQSCLRTSQMQIGGGIIKSLLIDLPSSPV